MLQRNSEQLDDGLNEPVGSAVERSSQPTVDLGEMARILRRRWKMVAAPPLALVVVAVTYVLLATTYIPPPPRSWSIHGAPAPSKGWRR